MTRERGTPAPRCLVLLALVAPLMVAAAAEPAAAPAPQARLRVEELHAWRPPYGVERVGRSRVAAVEFTGERPAGEFALSACRGGKVLERQAVVVPDKAPFVARAAFQVYDFDEIVLESGAAAAPAELARERVTLPPFEADAVARPDRVINPVDLGAILVPSDWLLLGPGQAAQVTARAITRAGGPAPAVAQAWFESDPGKVVPSPLSPGGDKPAEAALSVPAAEGRPARDVLHVSLVDAAGKELWKKSIQTMRVNDPPKLPAFGAVRMKLRYDAPISLRDPKTGQFSTMPYEKGWAPELDDVVVALPNGSRFVFWRGSSYIPFWAGLRNNGFCYEWAEKISPSPGGVDCVEPLMDKELRYGRVEIVESTAARVHVRWTYQSTDFNYKVWGDHAVEDYFFYPDGFGTRVLNLKSDPAAEYELSEFIVLTPAATYPLGVVPEKAVDILFADGQKREVHFPPVADKGLGEPRNQPAIYRVRFHRDEPAAAIYFNPHDLGLPAGIFPPFYDAGQLVTPAYWGSHWPLARGNSTGWAIDARVAITPCHTSLMTWQGNRPPPVSTSTKTQLNTLGRPAIMRNEQRVWLIGQTDAPDERLLQWERSFGRPPAVELTGARIDFAGYVEARRAIALTVEGTDVSIMMTPEPLCVNPVLELAAAPKELERVTLDGAALPPARYTWDGRVLWLDATFDKSVTLRLEFRQPETSPTPDPR